MQWARCAIRRAIRQGRAMECAVDAPWTCRACAACVACMQRTCSSVAGLPAHGSGTDSLSGRDSSKPCRIASSVLSAKPPAKGTVSRGQPRSSSTTLSSPASLAAASPKLRGFGRPAAASRSSPPPASSAQSTTSSTACRCIAPSACSLPPLQRLQCAPRPKPSQEWAVAPSPWPTMSLRGVGASFGQACFWVGDRGGLRAVLCTVR